MIDFFKNEAYAFYPKNISGLDYNYNNTGEFTNLYLTLKKRIDQDYDSWKELIEELNNKKLHILDKTTFTTNQPSLAFELILSKRNNYINVIHLYYSGLISYFYYAYTKHSQNDISIKEISVNRTEVFQHTGINVISLIEERFKAKVFPEKYLDVKIPEISFEAIEKGNFTFRNAFFNTRHLLI